MRILLLLALSCAQMFASSPENKEIINPAPKRFYINNLDIIEYHEGAFRVIFYMSENFDVFDGVNLKRVRANKNGIYFLKRDIINIFKEPWQPTPQITNYPPIPDLDEFPPDIIDPISPIQHQDEDLT